MNEEVKAKYLAALRGGEYKQTRGAFRRESGCYCAIGLLVELVAQPVWTARIADDDDRGMSAHVATGITLEDVGVTGRQWRDVVTFNDDDGLSFAQIADYVEAWW